MFISAHICLYMPTRMRIAHNKRMAFIYQHMRIAHNVRSPMRAYAFASGLCASCGVCFQTRLRLLGHLSDARRPKCHEWHLLHATLLDAATMARLDAMDAAARLKAQRHPYFKNDELKLP